MKQVIWNTARVVLLSSVVVMSILVVCAPRASQAHVTVTAVCQTITQSTTWTVISSPFEVCNTSGLTIGPTATLTIQPGVTVQFQPGVNTKLNVQGVLNAIGTVTQPITFTGVLTTPGSWAGIEA